MLYLAYQAGRDAFTPYWHAADIIHEVLRQPRVGPVANGMLRAIAAGADLFGRSRLAHERPGFDISSVRTGAGDVPVMEEASLVTPFGTLLHFRKDMDRLQPRVLLVAPMAGHFATLLADTVRTLLPDHDVYITDWTNARDVPIAAGRFGLDEYVAHIIRFLEQVGPGAHVVGICQPCNALLAAVAVMEQADNAATPRTVTLMAGPVDARVDPTRVNQLAAAHPVAWFERNLIAVVPARFAGVNRRVYPGFLQLSAFMAMNPARHLRAHLDLFGYAAKGEEDKAGAIRKFYDEYCSVLDLPAEFYLETVQRVFQEHHLARGLFTWRGSRVDARAITRSALLTVEGERDDICSPGQTLAAHDLCSSLKPRRKKHYLQPGVGHYGVFSGSRWRDEIYPHLRRHIAVHD